MTAFDRVLDALTANGSKITRSNDRQASAQCPAHEDREPSLSVTRIEGQVLVHCHAGCDTRDVLATLGFGMADLYDNPKTGAVYRYDDGRVVRRQYTPDREFKQYHTKGRPTLYRLAKVQAAVKAGQPIWLVEGEKDVHALESLDAVATTAPMGASNVGNCDLSPLHGAEVLAVHDHDDSGQRWAQTVRAKLDGKSGSLAFYAPKVGNDSADHIAAGYGLDDFLLVDVADHGSPAGDDPHEAVEPPTPKQIQIDQRYTELAGQVLDLDRLRKIPPPDPIIENYLFRNSLGWLGGKPGSAKSFVAVEVACCVGTGTPWHDHPVKQAGRVLYVIAEGASGMAQRVDAWALHNGKPVENVRFLPVPVDLAEAGRIDVGAFTQLATELRPTLIIIDTQARVTVGVEENSSRDMGRFVDALEVIRRACGACILVIHHEPRNGENLRGSSALEGVATTVLRVAKDGDVVELSNPKQKDIPEQPPFRLGLKQVGPSAILSHEAVGVADFLTQSERHVLTVLWESSGSSGCRKTELQAMSALPPTTWFRTIKALVNKGKVTEREEGRSKIITPAAVDRQTSLPLLPPDSHSRDGSNSLPLPLPHPFRGGSDGSPGLSESAEPPFGADVEGAS
jgi:hypothetical protein